MCEYSHCIRAEGGGEGVNTCYEGANTYFKNNSSRIFSCICASAHTGPTCIHAKMNSPIFLSCMYWFCAEGFDITRFVTIRTDILTISVHKLLSFLSLFFGVKAGKPLTKQHFKS